MNENQKSTVKAALIAAAAVGLTMAGAPAFAELPASISTDVGAAKADMLEAIGICIGALVAVWGLMKLGKKLGWL